MSMKLLSSACFVLCVASAFAQAPAPSPAKPPAPTARISGRVVAADTGKPLRRASVTLMAQPSKTTRVTETDSNGRYEFSRLPAGRYSVRPSKDGYVVMSPDPFSVGVGVELYDGQIEDQTDFSLPRGSVITGRITDEFGEPMANVMVQARRYQFRPSGQRQLMEGNSTNFYMPGGTNDRGEYRIFGLRPGSYYVSANTMDMSGVIALAQSGGPGIGALDTNDGLATTFYPGTANAAEAQAIEVGLMQQASASFTLVPARMSRISGTVLDSQGQPLSGARVMLRPASAMATWFGNSTAQLSSTGTFTMANVMPGDYTLEVRPNPAQAVAGGQPVRNEFASLPVSVAGDVVDLAITTAPGMSISGRVIFEGKSDEARQVVRISAVPEEDARNVVQYMAGDAAPIDADGRFHLPSVYGKVIFRAGFLPQNVMLKAVRLNGVDISNTPFDATRGDDITNLEVVLVDQQSRIVAYARNARGELQYNFRFIVYPANVKPGDVTVRFQHNASPLANGSINIGRMPPGEYVGLAVHGVQPGEEWNPELRKRIEQFGKRFTLKEGETLELDVPYME
jgi:protocatechuate 3,4-dioxygenase beta subunit